MSKKEYMYDVVIVGAGIAGLVAAQKLLEKKACDASNILFVEALDRLGGRLLKLTQDVDRTPNNPVDVGACWICPEQPQVWQLAKDLGLTVVEQTGGELRVHLKTSGGFTGWLASLFKGQEEQERRASLMKMPKIDVIEYLR